MAANGERVCVVIGRTRHKMVAVELQEAGKRGAELIELRLDFLARAVDYRRLLAERPCPLIATVRRPKDGGRWGGTEDARKMLLRQAIVAGFDWVDLETDIADEIRRFGKVKRIVSYHNLNETPIDLAAIYERMCTQDADIVKMSVTALAPSDNLRVLELLARANRPTVAHCMGDIGQPSRFLALRYPQVPFIYAAFNKERGVAPGLPAFDDIRHVYRLERLNEQTEVFGVVGDPVAHSLSPLLHNKLFRDLDMNAIYLPFRVPRHQLPGFLTAFEQVPVRGYSVTIPHKEAAAGSAHEKDHSVELTRAANTLLYQPDTATFSASNTDYRAILAIIEQNQTINPNNRPPGTPKPNALVCGAGGVARAAGHALHHLGYHIIVANRTVERAKKLAEDVGGKAVDWEARHGTDCDLVINCTPVGMHPDVDETPLHVSLLKPGVLVFDSVYTPETTLLVREARERGCLVVTGVELFVRQAAMQFELFTGLQPNLERMRHIVRRALSPVTMPDDED